MATDTKKLCNNMAGIEFVACMDEIKEFLQKSWKYTQIHRHLRQAGKITMSYGSFCYHARRLSLDQHRPGEQPAAQPKATPFTPKLPGRPRHVAPVVSTFPDPRTMNPDDAL